MSRTPRLLSVMAALPLALLAAPASAKHPSPYRIVETTTTVPAPGLHRTLSVVQVGNNPVNRFQMVRVQGQGCHGPRRGAMLILPPVSNGFENYEATDTGYAASFAAFFASRGYDVWGLSQRTEGLVAGACESGAYDCTPMAEWGLDTLVDDAEFVRGRIAAEHPGRKPVIGGISLGAMATVAAIDRDPHAYAGAFLLEGAIYDADPAEQAIAQGFCDAAEGALAAGVYYDDQQLPGMRGVAQLASFAPDAPSPIPGMPPGFTNHQAYVALMNGPGLGPLTPFPGYAFLTGDPFEDRFYVASDTFAMANMSTFVDYATFRILRDVDCGLAGERTFTSKLGRVHLPVFVNAGGHGFGPAMLDTLALMPHADTTVNYVPELGHMDHFFAVDHRALTEEPILAWMEEIWGR